MVPYETIDISAWVAAQTGKHLCACGCGNPVQIRPRHHWKGIPPHIQGHHLVHLRKQEEERLHEAGLLSAPDVARTLGVGRSTLSRLARQLPDPVTRGKRSTLRFTPDQVAALRAVLDEVPRHGAKGPLVYLQEVARLADCNRKTIHRRRASELPAGRWVTRPRTGWAFTLKETQMIVEWVKRHRRGRQGRRPGR